MEKPERAEPDLTRLIAMRAKPVHHHNVRKAVDNYDMEDAGDGGDDGYGIGSSGNGRHSDEDDHGPAADKLFALRRRYDNGDLLDGEYRDELRTSYTDI